MIGLGVHPLGLNPITSASLYKKIIVPTALYGSELWNNMSQNDTNSINRLQHFIVKLIQGFNIRTRSDMCESMLGLCRLSAEVEIRKLLFVHKILLMQNESITHKLFIRKYLLYISNNNSIKFGFIPDICALLQKYNLQFLVNDFTNKRCELPSKYFWKRIVKKAVYSKEKLMWQERLRADSDFIYFRLLQKDIKPALVYTLSKDYVYILTENKIAKIWSRSVTLENETCIFCDANCEDYISNIVENYFSAIYVQ